MDSGGQFRHIVGGLWLALIYIKLHNFMRNYEEQHNLYSTLAVNDKWQEQKLLVASSSYKKNIIKMCLLAETH